jgi:hypothetical protein
MDKRPDTIELSQYRVVKLPPRRPVHDMAPRRALPSFADRSADADIDGKILAWIRSHVTTRNGGRPH